MLKKKKRTRISLILRMFYLYSFDSCHSCSTSFFVPRRFSLPSYGMQCFCRPADVMYWPSFSMPNRAGIHSPYSAFLTNTLSNGFIVPLILLLYDIWLLHSCDDCLCISTASRWVLNLRTLPFRLCIPPNTDIACRICWQACRGCVLVFLFPWFVIKSFRCGFQPQYRHYLALHDHALDFAFPLSDSLQVGQCTIIPKGQFVSIRVIRVQEEKVSCSDAATPA